MSQCPSSAILDQGRLSAPLAYTGPNCHVRYFFCLFVSVDHRSAIMWVMLVHMTSLVMFGKSLIKLA